MSSLECVWKKLCWTLAWIGNTQMNANNPSALCTLNPHGTQNFAMNWIVFNGTSNYCGTMTPPPCLQMRCHLSARGIREMMPGLSPGGMCQVRLRVWLGIMLAVCPGKRFVAHRRRLRVINLSSPHKHTQNIQIVPHTHTQPRQNRNTTARLQS